MDVDHDSSLLLVDLRGVHVQVQAVLVAHRLCGADVVLGADVAVVGSVVVLGVGFDLDWRLKFDELIDY